MQVRGPGVAAGLLDENWLITCERALLTKGSDSSFAEAHRGFNSEPIHIEDEVEDQEDEEEDGRDCEECKVESRREVRKTSA